MATLTEAGSAAVSPSRPPSYTPVVLSSFLCLAGSRLSTFGPRPPPDTTRSDAGLEKRYVTQRAPGLRIEWLPRS